MVIQHRRPSVSKIGQSALQFINWRDQEAVAKKNKNRERAAITKYLVPDPDAIDAKDVKAGNPNNVDIDEEKGHRRWWFDKPVSIGGRTILGLELQRKVTGPFMDPDVVEAYFSPYMDDDGTYGGLTFSEYQRRKELWKQIYHPVEEWIIDFDVIYRLQQEGRISKEEVEGLMQTDISWSLNVKEER